MEIKQVKLGDITPYKNNAKKHDKTQIANVAESIKQFGFVQPIVLSADNTIVIGHCRYLAAKKLGMDSVPCYYVEELTDEQIRKLRNLDNKFNESEWDLDLLSLDIDGLDFSGFDVDWGIPETEEEAEIIEDEVPEVDEENEPICKLGDLWLLGDHRLLCGDSTDKETVEKLMNGDKADMVFTDPPYGINAVDKNGKIASGKVCKPGIYAPIIGDNSTDTAEKAYLIIKELCDKHIIWGGNYFIKFLPFSDGWIVWDKREGTCRNDFSDGEMAWCSFHTPLRIYHQLWNGMIKKGESGKRYHPSQKPIKLLADILEDFSNEADLILDLFGGSGSTLIACEQLNRKCYMLELSPKYCDVIIKRWETLTGKKAVKIN